MQVPKNYKYNTEQIRRGTAALAETDYLMIKYIEAEMIIRGATRALEKASPEGATALQQLIDKYTSVKDVLCDKWLELVSRETLREKVRKAESDLKAGV